MTNAMQDMAYHSAMMPPVRPIWLDDTSFWLLGSDNAVRRGITTTIEGRAYQVRYARELTVVLDCRSCQSTLRNPQYAQKSSFGLHRQNVWQFCCCMLELATKSASVD